ncbi:MAG TPA: hypothetical protein VKR83_18675 [Ktedonobacteraceae bacterium]|nr:hypothetical protein [Ktedonobacteraceae bacterium]
MHRTRGMGAHDAPYIWLRYSTQFTTGGRTHTIEMDIPVPVGASAEEREQLIREAEAGIEQLYRQIEKRGSQRNQRSPESGRPQETAASAVPTRPAQPSPTPPLAARTPARDTPQAIPLQEKLEAAPARNSIGAEMPMTHNLSGSVSGNIRLAQFIQIIKNNWGLTPKEAMDLLQVKTLNNMNYRDLLRELEPLVQKRVPTPASSTTQRDAGARPVSAPAPELKPTPPATATNRAPAPPPPSPTISPKPHAPAVPPALAGPTNIPVFPIKENMLREVPRSYKFDEEEELEAPQSESDAGDDEEQGGMSEALARIKVDELKEIRGTSMVGSGRLVVLHNLLDSQISATQFQQLIEGLWNINSDKRLKQDHVEALISWAKEDYFEDEVNAVLAVLNE